MKKRNLFQFGDSSEKRKSTVSNYLQMCAEKSIQCSPIDFGVPWMGGLRSNIEQKDIFIEGNSRADGYIKLSFHQKTDNEGKGLALDLAPYVPSYGFSYKAFGHFGIIGMLMLEAWEELQEAGLE